MRMFASGGEVPAGVARVPFKLLLHHAQRLERLTHFGVSAVADGALAVVWGRPEDVEYCTADLGSKVVLAFRQVDLQYFVHGLTRRGAAQAMLMFGRSVMRLIGDTTHFREQVRLATLTASLCP